MPFNAGASGRENGREAVRVGSVALGVVMVIVRMMVTTGLDDVERETALQLHAGRSKDGPQRTRGASLLPDDLTDIGRGDMQTKDSRFLFGNGLDPDGVGIIDKGPGNLGH
jgi:hypothetical protein